MPTFGTDLLLPLITQVAGGVLLVGTMLLVGCRRIYFDATTKEQIEVTLPILGKVKTHAPAFALILVAAVMVIYPLSRARPDLVNVEGEVTTQGKPVTLLLIAVPQYQTTLLKPGSFHFSVPILKDATYRMIYVADSQVIADNPGALSSNGTIQLKPVTWMPSWEDNIPVSARKEISDEELHKLGIIH